MRAIRKNPKLLIHVDLDLYEINASVHSLIGMPSYSVYFEMLNVREQKLWRIVFERVNRQFSKNSNKN